MPHNIIHCHRSAASTYVGGTGGGYTSHNHYTIMIINIVKFNINNNDKYIINFDFAYFTSSSYALTD